MAPGHNVDFNTTDVKAYKVVEVVKGNTSYARLEEVSIVPANEAVVVRSDNGAGTYQIPVVQTASALQGNRLKAATSAFPVTEENTIYCIAVKDGKTGFYPVTAGVTVPKGKGYLDMSSSQVKPASILFDDNDDPTGIVSPLEEMEEEALIYYNVAGQRLSKPQRSINIVGGKKILF